MSMRAQTLSVDDVRAIAAGLPAKYEKQRQADQTRRLTCLVLCLIATL